VFVSGLRDRLRDQPIGQRDVMLYVHGYNNSFADGVFRTVQLMHDFDLPGVGVHYSWPSAAHPLGYAYDRDSVLFARDGLEKLLRLAGQANPDRIILVGHSLGAMMVMETLRQIEIGSPNWAARHLGGVVLVSPDLDIEVFKQQAQRFARLPDPFLIFVSQKDRALQLSSQINGNKTRLGLLEDPTKISDLPVTVVDLSEFARNSDDRHFTLGTSPLLIQLLNNSPAVSQTFDRDAGGRMGLLPGTAITVQSATKIILSPLMLQN
jgi:esterase/lipase superfamily enzyme